MCCHFNHILLGAFQMPLCPFTFPSRKSFVLVMFALTYFLQLLSIGVPSHTLKWMFKQERHLRFLQAALLLLLMDMWTLLEEIAFAWVNSPMSTGQKPLREQGMDCIVILKVEHSTLSFIQSYISQCRLYKCSNREKTKVILQIQSQ